MEGSMTEVERVKPRAMYVEEAIQLALESRWADAVACNRRLIEQHGPDEEAYNRLGKALSELGQLQEGLDAYQETLALNPINLIAPKMIKKITALLDTPASATASGSAAIDVDLFTEEPGKSALTRLTTPRGGATAQVDPGDAVELEVDGSTLHARTAGGIELGLVDSKLARRLLPLMETGNRYSAAVARVDAGHIEVMIRETFQAPENARKTSFPIARGSRQSEFRPYAKESLLLDRDDEGVAPDDEEEGGFVEPALGGDDDLEAGVALDVDADEAIAEVFDDEDEDDDSRPEDSY
jgi:tetratricopeptide (TPR) repeat protein